MAATKKQEKHGLYVDDVPHDLYRWLKLKSVDEGKSLKELVIEILSKAKKGAR